MTSIRGLSASALCALLSLFISTPLLATEDGDRAQDIGVVHASGDEAWIDVPASLGETWKATLAELKERGHLPNTDASYVDTNGQIALDTLWIAVLPGASLGAPVSRVRIVVLVSADDHEKHTAALVGAGAILGAIAERLPARGATPAPYVATEPPVEPQPEYTAETVATDQGLVNTYNTYNTYSTYEEPYYPTITPYYYPSVVYVYKPWWWLGWCHNGWFVSWSPSCWNWSWGWGWGGCGWGGGGWGSFCNPWWGTSVCWSNWHCNPSWWDCNNSFAVAGSSSVNSLRLRNNFAASSNLSFAGRDLVAASATPLGSSHARDATLTRDPTSSVTTRSPGLTRFPRSERSPTASLSPSSSVDLSPRASGRAESKPGVSRWRISDGLSSVNTFPPRTSPGEHSASGDDRGSRSSSSRSSGQPSRSIVVSTRSNSGTRAKPGSVTKMKGINLTTRLGSISDGSSVARATTPVSSSSPVSTSMGKPTSPFTIGSNGSNGHSSSAGSSPGTAPSAAPASSRTIFTPQPSAPASSSSSRGRSSSSPSPAPQPAAPRASSSSPRSSGSSLGSLGSGSLGGSRSSGGSSMGNSGGSHGGGSSMGGGGGRSSGGSSMGSSRGGGGGGGRGPR